MTAQPVEVTILWNGGWDRYLVDTSITVSVPEAELQGNARMWPTFECEEAEGSFLKASFSSVLKKSVTEGCGVRILRRLGGGD